MLGFFIVLLASFFFCFQNVIVRVLFTEHAFLGLFPLGGFVTPTLPHSFLLLAMRMLLVVPLMSILASRFYPPTWKELASLAQPPQRGILLQSIAGGGLMFLYLALLYLSVGMIPTGIAMTLFFTYPVFTALFSWGWFGDRPTRLQWGVMGIVLLGSALTMPHPSAVAPGYNWIGVTTGIASGVAYAFYTVVAQKSFTDLHPVPYTWVSFATTLVLSCLCLPFGQSQETLPWVALWIGGLCSAIVTFAGHVLTNIGIRLIGATTAAMIGTANPAFTVVLAWGAIQETLKGGQLMGVAIVTVGVVLLSRDRSLKKP
ncbi:transporter [Leptolyngbya sp. 'hensonii']|uniref:DMT family transporter n=1 Tax=Leptolyngbya sp. 'hensonii' TaxID=1922337 RepID=UPI00094F893F|nr:DMT family transporter [Leptolyngbya sp. 'hensonii']OLP16593.1 transporter [Leptolyngbya sp. 'hensonii']